VTGARDAVGPQGLRPVSDRAALAYQHEQQLRLGIPAAAGMPTASNAWVIAPQRSTAGHTVLATAPAGVVQPLSSMASACMAQGLT
jgi:penicillin amidase